MIHEIKTDDGKYLAGKEFEAVVNAIEHDRESFFMDDENKTRVDIVKHRVDSEGNKFTEVKVWL